MEQNIDITSKRFVVTFPLKVTKHQDAVLKKRFEYAEIIRDRLFQRMYNRYKDIIQTRVYRERHKSIAELYKSNDEIENEIKTLSSNLKDLKKEEKKLNKEKIKELKETVKKNKDTMKELFDIDNAIFKENNLTKFGFFNEVKDIYKPFNTHIDSMTAMSIAENIWRGFESVMYNSSSKRLQKKRKNTLMTLRGRSNASGIKLRNGEIQWNGLNLPVMINEKNPYEIECFQNEIAYITIKKRWFNRKNYYFAQIMFKGVAPAKYDLITGEFKRILGDGIVNIRVDKTYVVVEKEEKTIKYNLCPNLETRNDELILIETMMERSRRQCNPCNYNNDGTSKRNTKNNPLVWFESKNYQELKKVKHDLNEKIKINRKIAHEKLSNEILSYGTSFNIVSIDAKKEQEKDGNGCGKIIMDYAPAMFVEILKRKIELLGGTFIYTKE